MNSPKPELTLAELVASLALATDMALGHPMEQGLGTAIVATRLGELAGLSEDELADTYHLALLRHIGCTTERDGLAALVGDEIGLGGILDPLTGGASTEYLAAFARYVSAGRTPVGKARALGHLAAGLPQFQQVNAAICEVAQMLASRLGFGRAFTDALATVYERWDGRGMPNRVKGEGIPPTVRLTQIADLASALHDLGHADAVEVVRTRAGSGFDPALAGLFVANAGDLLVELDVASRWDAALKIRPGPPIPLAGDRLESALSAVADFADLQSTYLVGHSSGLAGLARTAAARRGLPASDAADVGLAALVHDLGRVGVSAGVWSKPGPLTAGEWERVRLHPYHTDRILQRAPFLARLSALASNHHERLDGSGYYRGATGLSAAARVLAAADAYHAMLEPRPHRPALVPTHAADELGREVRAGRIDRESADAVLEAAGQRVGRRKEHASGLTAREVEVLRLVARGRSTKDVARVLVISAKTAENHLSSIYAKAGVRSRAAAAVFAMQHGLLDPLAGPGDER